MTLKMAFDKSTVRSIDADGRMHIAKSRISKANICPYYGREIPDWQGLGLDPEKVYQLYRDPVELKRGADTFARLPILSKHVPVTVEAPQPDLVVGAIGSDVDFDGEYLNADLCVWDANAIAGIETDKVRELSCAYRYVPVMEAGEANGQKYDGRMTEIRGNHLALVESGRAGSDVIVADSNPFLKDPAMKMTKLGKALFAALSAASPKLAQDSATQALVGRAARKNFNKKEVSEKLLALDTELDPQQLDNVIDALLEVEESPEPMQAPDMPAKDEGPADKVKALLAGKVDESIINEIVSLFAAPAADGSNVDAQGNPYPRQSENKEEGMKPEEVKAAMDAMSSKLRTEMREANEAARAVRHIVGDVTMDSAEEIYAFALDQMKVDHKDVQGVHALRALFTVASKTASAPAPIAQDSKAALEAFPGLSRFRQA